MFHVKRLALLLVVSIFPAWSQETVTFSNGGLTLQAELYRPKGGGPFPAVVMLHGCSGMRTAKGGLNPTYHDWALRLNDAGFAALLVDSFGPRGEKEICTQRSRRIRPDVERVEDAHAARRWLREQKDMLPGDIHVFGWSNGGMTVLHAVAPMEGDGFRSAVAFYPGCGGLLKRGYRPNAPLLIQAGGDDDWTPARHCVALAARAREAGATVEIDVYPGAHHAFDRPLGRLRYRPDVRNASSPTGWGAHVGPHPEARDKSRQRALAFVKANSGVFHVEHGASARQMP